MDSKTGKMSQNGNPGESVVQANGAHNVDDISSAGDFVEPQNQDLLDLLGTTVPAAQLPVAATPQPKQQAASPPT